MFKAIDDIIDWIGQVLVIMFFAGIIIGLIALAFAFPMQAVVVMLFLLVIKGIAK